jgi:hypothetical protein
MSYLRIAAGALLACLVAAPAADAAPKRAVYQLNLNGDQVTTWDYHKRQKPSCDWPEEGHGSQEIDFFTPDRKPVKLTVTAGPGGSVSFKPAPLRLEAVAELDAEWKRYYTRQSACPGGGGPFGGDGQAPQDDIGSDHCLTSGNVDLKLLASKRALTVSADPAWLEPDYDSYRSLAALCGQLDHPNAVLGLGDTRGEYLGAIVESSTKLSAKKLLDRKTKKLKLSGDATVAYPNSVQTAQPNDTTTGKTVVTWNATLKRVW